MIDKRDIWLVQYRETTESLRQFNRFMWQLPSWLILIVGTLVAVVFTFMAGTNTTPPAPLWAREGILGIAFIATIVMCFVQRRYRYFGSIMVGSLSALEQELEVKHIQNTAYSNKNIYKPRCTLTEYSPGCIFKHGLSGDHLLFGAMLFMTVVIIALMFLLVVNPHGEPNELVYYAAPGGTLITGIGLIYAVQRIEKGGNQDRKVKSMEEKKQGDSDRKFAEGVTAMTAGLTFIILGGTVLGLPQWSAAIFIPGGIIAYLIGLRCYRGSKK